MQSQIRKQLEAILNNKELDEQAVLEQARKVLNHSDAYIDADLKAFSMGILIEQTMEDLRSEVSNVIPYPWVQLNNIVGGLSRGELVIIGGRPGMGKSTFAMNILAHCVLHYVPALFWSIDMNQRQAMLRMVDLLSGNSIDNRFSQDDTTSNEVLEKWKDIPLYISDDAIYSMEAMKVFCRKQVEEKGIQLLVIDYIQLLASRRYRHNRESEIAYISKTLKLIARELNIAIVCTSQVSRMVEQRGGEKRPILSDLRESGAIEQDADKVLFLYRPEYYGFRMDEEGRSTAGIADVIIAKNRRGPLTTVTLSVDFVGQGFSDFKAYNSGIVLDQKRLNESGLGEEDKPF
jgi:replicative DNA helicase